MKKKVRLRRGFQQKLSYALEPEESTRKGLQIALGDGAREQNPNLAKGPNVGALRGGGA